jgi:hypothetical protein
VGVGGRGVHAQVVARAIGVADALDPAVRGEQLGVPAVDGVVGHLVGEVLTEAQAGGFCAHLPQQQRSARHEVAQILAADDLFAFPSDYKKNQKTTKQQNNKTKKTNKKQQKNNLKTTKPTTQKTSDHLLGEIDSNKTKNKTKQKANKTKTKNKSKRRKPCCALRR